MARAVATLAALAALGAGPAEPRSAGPSTTRFVPDPGPSAALQLRGEVVVADAGDYTAELELLDGTARRAFLRAGDGTAEDPFATAPAGGTGFLTYRLLVSNRSRGDLVFQPQSVRLILRNGEWLTPLAWPDVLSAYARAGLEPPPAYTRVRNRIFDGEVVLAPGRSAEGLVVLRPPPSGTKRFRLEIPLVSSTGAEVGFETRYRLPGK